MNNSAIKCGATIAAITTGGAALAQTPPPTNGRLLFDFDRLIVTPQTPSVTLTVSAAWDQANLNDYLFTGADYDLVASDGRFTSAALLLGNNPPNNAGQPSGSRVNGAAIGQVVIPIPGGPCKWAPCPFPVPLAEYTWEATDFTPRTVDFRSESTSRFLVISYRGAPPVNLYPNDFTPGHGMITVVPAPASAVLLGVAGMLSAIRRRSR